MTLLVFDPYKPTITLHMLTLISKSGAAADSVYMSDMLSLTENMKFGHLMGVHNISIVRQARIQLVAKIQAAVCRVR